MQILLMDNLLNHLPIDWDRPIFIHGNAAVALSESGNQPADKLRTFFNQMTNHLGPRGTLIVPAFSYCGTKGAVYCRTSTKSQIGQFSEAFRNFVRPDNRSNNPIFSVCAIGHDQKFISDLDEDDCFGTPSIFSYLYETDAQILCLGCSVNSITFIHYCEQIFGVSYRFFKTFNCRIRKNDGEIIIQDMKYFVRDLSLKSDCQLTMLKDSCLKEGAMFYLDFNRLPIYLIGAKDFYRAALKLLNSNEYSLIQENFHRG
jgi:aminoglycoside 3-N-acetyltransferase